MQENLTQNQEKLPFSLLYAEICSAKEVSEIAGTVNATGTGTTTHPGKDLNVDDA